MNNIKLISAADVCAQTPLTKDIDNASEAKKKQFAKDFESVFINKLLDEMKNTIGDWGSEKDGAGKQIDDIFWSYLSQDIANNGGFGLGKNIYQSLTDTKHNKDSTKLLDKSL
jgi:Rod binding domain-containing protein